MFLYRNSDYLAIGQNSSDKRNSRILKSDKIVRDIKCDENQWTNIKSIKNNRVENKIGAIKRGEWTFAFIAYVLC